MVSLQYLSLEVFLFVNNLTWHISKKLEEWSDPDTVSKLFVHTYYISFSDSQNDQV
jgi:hypothetical protein